MSVLHLGVELYLLFSVVAVVGFFFVSTLFTFFITTFCAIIISVFVFFLEAVLIFEILWFYVSEMFLDNTLVGWSRSLSESFVRNNLLGKLIGLWPFFSSKW